MLCSVIVETCALIIVETCALFIVEIFALFDYCGDMCFV